MKIRERIRNPFRRRPPTEEERAARAKEIREHDFVRLRRDLPQVELAEGTVGAVVNMLDGDGLAEGTVGVVVADYGDGAAFEVEVCEPGTANTLFLGTLSADDLERVPRWNE